MLGSHVAVGENSPPILGCSLAVGQNQWDPILGPGAPGVGEFATHFRLPMLVVGYGMFHGGLTDLDFGPWPSGAPEIR